jgi:Uma2 family endonuclease
MSSHAAARRIGYSWEDYRSWDDGQRWEIIGGDAYAMSPAPGTRHQLVVGRLYQQMARRLRGKPCEVFLSPVDVRLSAGDVVQPDLAVVCDKARIRPTHIEGPPTLVVEVISPATALLDRTLKMRLYAQAGVREVWLVTPYPWLVEVFVLDGKNFRLAGSYRKEDVPRSPGFPDLRIDLERVFDFPLEPGEEIALVKEGHPPYRTAT